MYGGNSNWRGPIWMPMNYLVIRSLARFHEYVGADFTVEYPTGSGTQLTLLRDRAGPRRPHRRRSSSAAPTATDRSSAERPASRTTRPGTTCCSSSTSTATTVPGWARRTRPDGRRSSSTSCSTRPRRACAPRLDAGAGRATMADRADPAAVPRALAAQRPHDRARASAPPPRSTTSTTPHLDRLVPARRRLALPPRRLADRRRRPRRLATPARHPPLLRGRARPTSPTTTSAARASPSPATGCTSTSAATRPWPGCARGSPSGASRLMLDFVPNHTALDHPWVADHPECYIEGTADDLASAPGNWIRLDAGGVERVLAYGRDPYFAGWPDTLQLDYSRPSRPGGHDRRAARRGEPRATGCAATWPCCCCPMSSNGPGADR